MPRTRRSAGPTTATGHCGELALTRGPGRARAAPHAESETPYEYVVAVNRYLQDGFRYDETPDPVDPGVAQLDGFLFDTKSGYCQHYSAAMALPLPRSSCAQGRRGAPGATAPSPIRCTR